MSLPLIHLVWQRYPEGSSDLDLLLAIAEAANEQGNSYTTMTQLAAAARLSRAQAFRALRRLKDERWIVSSRILGQGGTLCIQINLPKLERSTRPGVDMGSLDAQRLRQTGTTEAELLERVRDRRRGSHLATAKGPKRPPTSGVKGKPGLASGASGTAREPAGQTPLGVGLESEEHHA